MAETKKVSLKLLVDTKGHKVLFAEAGKEFVDFLFHIISLPIGTIANLLAPEPMVGSLGDLHNSLFTLCREYSLDDSIVFSTVLRPIPPICIPLLSLKGYPRQTFYRCSRCNRDSLTPNRGTKCYCGHAMSTMMTYVDVLDGSATTSSDNGYVKEVMTYMVMDNLEVKPMSAISSITLLNKLNLKNVASLVEKKVQVGLTEAIAIVKASLETKDVLTTVFLGKNI